MSYNLGALLCVYGQKGSICTGLLNIIFDMFSEWFGYLIEVKLIILN